MGLIRVSGQELKAGAFTRVGEAELARVPWEVVEVHADGSATVVEPEPPRSGYEPVMDSVSAPNKNAITMQTPVQTVHDIVYVRGPLARRYRCKGCDWVGTIPAEHP